MQLRGRMAILVIFISVSLVYAGFFSCFFGKITGDAITDDCTNVLVLYHFEGNLNDNSGNNNSGTANGATVAPGKFGQGYKFDGTDDYIVTKNNIGLTNSYSISFWMQPSIDYNGSNSISRVILNSPGSSVPSQGWLNLLIYNNAPDKGKISFGFYDGANYPAVLTSQNLWIKDNWYHIVAIFDDSANNLAIYVNGILSNKETEITGNPAQVNNKLYIGARSDNTKNFNGIVDELIIYNRVLNPIEISDLYNAGTSVVCNTCTPNCTSKQCGGDGCGGSCGSCSGTDVCNASGICILSCLDTDLDGICNSIDNCYNTSNSGQQDTDNDGYGNICDCDLNQDWFVDQNDTNLFMLAWLSNSSSSNWNSNADFDSDNVVGFIDFNILKQRLSKPVGDNSTCISDCSGKQCGGDGCGGSCGSCSGTDICDISGTCVPASTGGCDSDNDSYNSNNAICLGNDCDDWNFNINPNAIEVCDNIDNDCNSQIDENNVCHPADLDHDGIINQTEFEAYLDRWYIGTPGVTIELMAGAIELWNPLMP